MPEVSRGTSSQSTRRALVYAVGQRYLAFLVQLITSVILARFLSPAETGIYSLAAAAVAIGSVLREFGTSDYIITQRNISEDKLRCAYTVTIGIAWITAAALFLAAYPLARFYSEPGVAKVMHLLCLNFLLVPLGSTSMALLSKDLRFDILFWIQSLSVLVGAVVTVLCAVNGLSFESPAWGSVASISITIMTLCIYRPNTVFMWPGLTNLGQVVRFGGTLTVARVIESASSRVADFIVSAMLGFYSSGILSKANSLNGGFYEFFGAAIVRVATPVLADAHHRNASIVDGYRHALHLMSSVQWLFFGLMAILAPELVHILFGDKWHEAAPLVQIGAAAGLIYAPFMLCTPLLTACGAAATQLRINLLFAAALVGCLVIGSTHSVTAAASLALIAHAFRLWLFSRAVQGICGISTRAIVGTLGPTMLVSGAATFAAWMLRMILVKLNFAPLFSFFATSAVATFIFVSLVILTRHPLSLELNRIFSTVSSAVKKQR